METLYWESHGTHSCFCPVYCFLFTVYYLLFYVLWSLFSVFCFLFSANHYTKKTPVNVSRETSAWNILPVPVYFFLMICSIRRITPEQCVNVLPSWGPVPSNLKLLSSWQYIWQCLGTVTKFTMQIAQNDFSRSRKKTQTYRGTARISDADIGKSGKQDV